MKDGKIGFTHTERRDAAANRQRILDTAIRLFEQHGVEQVSMNQIATKAGIGPGTLYRRYRNKGELCLDLIKDNVVLCFEDIQAYLEHNHKDPPEQRLKGILRLFLRFRESKIQLLKGVEDSASTNRKKSGTRSPLYDELHRLLVELFNEMNKETVAVRNNIFKADMLLEALKSDGYLFQREVRGYSPEEILELLYTTFILHR
ncbi:TetR/AcrR family transcriptional regulator [Lederbergia sp. NSJ-179]|uniref:TetR/AcrR family transcriptional regulator n=1 Tax=Lederbergia sp. NSJ-179 TaxID=2931402 RepID=UPI001FD3C0FF|nr:TetR/AcrR family transcriptional regulator [Lederbergia sp. NSJ-179]MCJ7841876.1 TetR/AcrR family transcriptional regulator [Lederbergia sp. NSJ-179]